MSWGTCYSGSNNIHYDYPPLMSDGRNYTIYDPACQKNETLLKQTGIKTNFDYRAYLQQNAGSIMAQNSKAACDKCGFCQYGSGAPMNPQGKYLYKSCSDKYQQYGYQNSDLKNLYVSREALQSRLTAPYLSQQGSITKPRAK